MRGPADEHDMHSISTGTVKLDQSLTQQDSNLSLLVASKRNENSVPRKIISKLQDPEYQPFLIQRRSTALQNTNWDFYEITSEAQVTSKSFTT